MGAVAGSAPAPAPAAASAEGLTGDHPVPRSPARSPCRHPATTGTSGASHLATEKIVEEKRTHSTLFFHQEKSFHDHHVSWLIQ
jgi:hypothetical protein